MPFFISFLFYGMNIGLQITEKDERISFLHSSLYAFDFSVSFRDKFY